MVEIKIFVMNNIGSEQYFGYLFVIFKVGKGLGNLFDVVYI